LADSQFTLNVVTFQPQIRGRAVKSLAAKTDFLTTERCRSSKRVAQMAGDISSSLATMPPPLAAADVDFLQQRRMRM